MSFVPHARARRREAIVRELAGMGVTQKRMAALFGIAPASVSSLCKRAGVKPPREGAGWLPHKAKSRERAASMLALYQAGRTLEQIGQQYGITRERVRQLMTKHFGTRFADGGAHAKAEASRQRREQKRNAKSLIRWGCTWDQYVELRRLRKPCYAYRNQMNAAARRGIAWELTLMQWWAIWQQSGHWAERGRGQGYVMCRFGDVGPYAVGNVFIALATHNSAEAQAKKKIDPSLPIGVRRTKSGRYVAHRNIDGVHLRLGTHDTPDLAYAAYLRASAPQQMAA